MVDMKAMKAGSMEEFHPGIFLRIRTHSPLNGQLQVRNTDVVLSAIQKNLGLENTRRSFQYKGRTPAHGDKTHACHTRATPDKPGVRSSETTGCV